MYEKSCELIYEMISERIRILRDFKKMKNVDILPEADRGLISAIINNRRNDKKNKYLIPDGTKATYKSENTTPFVDIIAKNLGLKSTLELIIGNEEEIDAYAGCLFRLLILETYDAGTEEIRNSIEDLRSDYIPYALFSAYNEKKCEYDDRADLDAIVNKKILAYELDWELAKETSIERLYCLIRENFIDAFSEMFKNQPNTLKLDKRFSVFMTTKIIPLLYENRIKNPYVDDVKSRLRSGFDELVEDTYYIQPFSPEADAHTLVDAFEIKHNRIKWFEAYLDFVCRVAEVQMEDEDLSIGESLVDRWNSGMCI